MGHPLPRPVFFSGFLIDLQKREFCPGSPPPWCPGFHRFPPKRLLTNFLEIGRHGTQIFDWAMENITPPKGAQPTGGIFAGMYGGTQ